MKRTEGKRKEGRREARGSKADDDVGGGQSFVLFVLTLHRALLVTKIQLPNAAML